MPIQPKQKKRAAIYLTLLLSAAASGQARHPISEQKVIAYAKSVNVRELDPALPSQRLETWLQSGPTHVRIAYWRVAETCDLKPVRLSTKYPYCVRVGFSRGSVRGFFLLRTGTGPKTMDRSPEMFNDVVLYSRGFAKTGEVEQLSNLPAALDAMLNP